MERTTYNKGVRRSFPVPRAVLSSACAIILSFGLVACGGDGGNTVPEQGTGNGNSEETIAYSSETTQKMEIGSTATMANGGLKLTVNGIQRRPLTIFKNANIMTSNDNTSLISRAQQGDIVVEVDITYTWNQNTYAQSLTAESTSMPASLNDILHAGELMYVSGLDANGEDYISSNVLQFSNDGSTDTVSSNSVTDYDILNSPLAETGTEKSGAMLFVVSSNVTGLTLKMPTPIDGADVTDAASVNQGNKDVFELSLCGETESDEQNGTE